jgi:ADP-heptose:LPS heptosyltransferase
VRGARARHHAVGGGVLALTGPPQAVVLRALGLGDFLTAVPALRAVRRALPEHDLAVAAPAALAPLVHLAGVADRLLPAAGLEPLRWSGPPPTVAVNLHGRGPQSHRLLGALHPWWLVAYARTGAPERTGGSGPIWDPDEHEVDRWCRLVESAGWTADPEHLDLPVPDVASPAPGAVVVHPGAAYASRRWPADRFAAVVRRLDGERRHVVVTGTAEERPLAEAVAREAGLPASQVLAGTTDLLQLAALVASAALVICGDTGVAHLATAYRRPSVLLFGPTPPARWGPRTDGPHTVLWHPSSGGDPFGDRPDAALLRISVPEVIRAAGLRLGDSGQVDVQWSAVRHPA